MRLKKYLNEKAYRKTAVNKKNKAKRIINKGLPILWKELKWLNFNVSLKRLCMIMTAVYYRENVRFTEDGYNYHPLFKFIRGGDFYKMNTDIDIFLNEETVNFIKNNQKKKDLANINNKLNTELIYVLAHTIDERDKINMLKDDYQYMGYNRFKQYIMINKNYFIKICNKEKLEDNYSPTKALIFDLIGRTEYYKNYLKNLI